MYESLFRSVLFPLHEKVLNRRSTVGILKAYEASQWLDSDALATLQLRKLNALIAHAWSEVPFLRRHWQEHGLTSNPLKYIDELARYPVLTKSKIKDNYQDMIAKSWRGRTLTKTTGGSTGTPFRLEYTSESYAARTALMWRGYRWGHADLGRRTVYVWGIALDASRPARWREATYHWLYNRRMLNSFSLRVDNAHEYVAAINEARPKAIVGYVAPLVTLAEWILRSGAKVHSPAGIITGAEALSEAQRVIIQDAFRAPAFNTYGSREFGLIAAECTEKTGLHVSMDHMVVETVDDSNNVVRDQLGHVLISDLTNFGMPFVRYQIGDAATLSTRTCSCGRCLPLFAEVQGRTLDLIRTPDGRMLPGEFFPHLFKDFDFIRQYQVVQHTLDSLTVSIVAAVVPTVAELDRMKRHLNEALGTQVLVSVNLVDDIPLTLSGKRRTTISHVASPAKQT